MNSAIKSFIVSENQPQRRLKYIKLCIGYTELISSFIHQQENLFDENYINRIIKLSNEVINGYLYLDDYYLVNSFKYYVKKLKSSLINDIYSYDNLSNNIELVLRSWNNITISLYLDPLISKSEVKPRIALFEATPMNKDNVKSVEELEEITAILLDEVSLYHPIVRFATNKRSMKNTIDTHEIKGFHFSGHGSGSGIELLGEDWTSNTFSADEFISLFKNKTYHLYLVFLNTCMSDKFASTIRNYKRKKTKFYKTIGFSGNISPDEALDFSKAFYEEFVVNKDHLVAESIRIAKNKFKKSYYDGVAHLNKIIFCKR